MLKIIDKLRKSSPEANRLFPLKPSYHYKVFRIPKRSVGFRTIAQPTPRVKAVQKKIVTLLQKKVKIHPSAKAYVKNTGIVDNALVHLHSTYLLKIDLENFFNSITPIIMNDAFKKQGIDLSKDDYEFLSEFLFWNRSKQFNGALVLSVGAPSSPFISNFIMYTLDKKIDDICKSMGVNYSRYADDMTFSTNDKNILFDIYKKVEAIIKNEFAGKLKINKKKTIYSSKAHNRHVTGIVLSNSNKISLGRKRKRYISSLFHKFKVGKLSHYDILELKGLIGFSLYVEPDFIDRMKSKYGYSVFDGLKHYE